MVSSPIEHTSYRYRARLLLVVIGVLLSGQVVHSAHAQRPLVTSWEVSEADPTLIIPTDGTDVSEYDFTIDWGDGTVEQVQGDDPKPEHTYAQGGTYTVSITGHFPRLRYEAAGKGRLRDIQQWGDIAWETTVAMFAGARGVTLSALDRPNLSGVEDMSFMFARSDMNSPIGHWDVSNVTRLHRVFYHASFNQPLGSWDVSSVTDMSLMFEASKFNHPLADCDVSNVTNMSGLFAGSAFFNHPLADWDVSNVTNMSGLFTSAYRFNHPLEQWDVSSVTNMSGLFAEAFNFNYPLERWDISSVTDMSFMFATTGAFNQPLAGWDVSGVTEMRGMFRKAEAFNQPLSSWDVSGLTDMSDMFNGAIAFNQPLSSWDVSGVTNMHNMFNLAARFNQSLASWDVSNVTDFGNMFTSSAFNQSLAGWDVSSATDMSYLFAYTRFNQSLADWDVSNVVNFGNMFLGNVAFDQCLGSWDMRKARGMSGFLRDAQLSTENYDCTLIGWSQQPLRESLWFDGGESQHSTAGAVARQHIIDTFGWRIRDGGLDPRASVDSDLPEPTYELALWAPYPNPAREQATVSYELPDGTTVARLAVTDLLGREVIVLVDGPGSPGVYQARLGVETLPPGTYFVRLAAGNQTQTRTLIVAR